jgi:hypothetical protein
MFHASGGLNLGSTGKQLLQAQEQKRPAILRIAISFI